MSYTNKSYMISYLNVHWDSESISDCWYVWAVGCLNNESTVMPASLLMEIASSFARIEADSLHRQQRRVAEVQAPGPLPPLHGPVH